MKTITRKKLYYLVPAVLTYASYSKVLVAPDRGSYAEIKRLMGEHKNPKPSQIAKRFKFNIRNGKSNESISECVAELRCLTQFCGYGTVLNDMLRNRLVCGVNRNQIQQKLLNERSSLTLERALSIAISIESLINQLSLINQHQQQVPVSREEEPTSIFKTTESKPDKSCYRCNGNHKPETCPFKDKEYFYCKAEGRKI